LPRFLLEPVAARSVEAISGAKKPEPVAGGNNAPVSLGSGFACRQ
jgi:hypothetical protein